MWKWSFCSGEASSPVKQEKYLPQEVLQQLHLNVTQHKINSQKLNFWRNAVAEVNQGGFPEAVTLDLAPVERGRETEHRCLRGLWPMQSRVLEAVRKPPLPLLYLSPSSGASDTRPPSSPQHGHHHMLCLWVPFLVPTLEGLPIPFLCCPSVSIHGRVKADQSNTAAN